MTTDSWHRLPVAENLLNQKFQGYEPIQIWLSDITYIPTNEGWLYLAGHKDLFAHEIVGHAMGESLTKHLVSESLLKVVRGGRCIRINDKVMQIVNHYEKEVFNGDIGRVVGFESGIPNPSFS